MRIRTQPLPKRYKHCQWVIPLTNGYVIVCLRHNKDCTDKWRDKELVQVWIFKSSFKIVEKLEFNHYREFKEFKELFKNNVSNR